MRNLSNDLILDRNRSDLNKMWITVPLILYGIGGIFIVMNEHQGAIAKNIAFWLGGEKNV